MSDDGGTLDAVTVAGDYRLEECIGGRGWWEKGWENHASRTLTKWCPRDCDR